MAGSVTTGPVRPILDSLSYGSALDSQSLLQAWTTKHGNQLGFFIDGFWQKPEGRDSLEVKNTVHGEVVLSSVLDATQDDVSLAVASSQKAFKSWSNASFQTHASHLYSIARNLQKHLSVLSVVEAIDAGKLVKETRTIDTPAIIRSFYHYAGWAALKGETMRSWKPLGVVGIVVDASCPVLHLSNRIAAALAMGNTVIVQPSPSAPLSALLLADICSQAGLPRGVLNILTGTSAESLSSHPDVNCLSFVGTRETGRLLRQASAGTGKKLSMELHGRNPIIVLEEADIDSAVEGIVESAFYCSGQANICGSRLLIQETVYDKVIRKLKVRMSKLTVGNNLNKNLDIPPLIGVDVDSIESMLSQAQSAGAEVFKACPEPEGGNFLSPTLVTNAQTSSILYVNELPAPILVAVPFRTLKEGVTIANHSMYGLNASVWTEDVNVGMEAASLLNVGTVWINCQNFRDAAAGIGGNKGSGYGRMGGREGLMEFAQPSFQDQTNPALASPAELNKFTDSPSSDTNLPDLPASPAGPRNPASIDKTYKLFYGGAQKRPDSNSYKAVHGSDGQVLAYVPIGGRKDIRNAVDAALKAASGWKKRAGHQKAQIMYYMAENLQGKKQEVVSQLSSLPGRSDLDAAVEFETTIQRLFYWAAWCDKFGGIVEETPMYGLTVKLNEPIGVIGVVCPEDYPLLSFVSLIAPAIARGNAVVAVTSESSPIQGLEFHQILETSDVPAGVVNIISGSNNEMTKTLAQHHDVNALWYFGSEVGSQFVELNSVENFKRTWVNYGRTREWLIPEQGQGEEFLYHCTNSKTMWVPMGEIFAN